MTARDRPHKFLDDNEPAHDLGSSCLIVMRADGHVRDTEGTVVTGNLPSVPAISQAELEAIETYFSDILDMVLAPGEGAPTASSRHKHMP